MDHMQQVEQNANAEWLKAAWKTVLRLAHTGEAFTSDKVFLLTRGSTHEPRAMGAVMRKASRSGIIKPTGRWVDTGRKVSHNRPMREWIGANNA